MIVIFMNFKNKEKERENMNSYYQIYDHSRKLIKNYNYVMEVDENNNRTIYIHLTSFCKKNNIIVGNKMLINKLNKNKLRYKCLTLFTGIHNMVFSINQVCLHYEDIEHFIYSIKSSCTRNINIKDLSTEVYTKCLEIINSDIKHTYIRLDPDLQNINNLIINLNNQDAKILSKYLFIQISKHLSLSDKSYEISIIRDKNNNYYIPIHQICKITNISECATIHRIQDYMDYKYLPEIRFTGKKGHYASVCINLNSLDKLLFLLSELGINMDCSLIANKIRELIIPYGAFLNNIKYVEEREEEKIDIKEEKKLKEIQKDEKMEPNILNNNDLNLKVMPYCFENLSTLLFKQYKFKFSFGELIFKVSEDSLSINITEESKNILANYFTRDLFSKLSTNIINLPEFISILLDYNNIEIKDKLLSFITEISTQVEVTLKEEYKKLLKGFSETENKIRTEILEYVNDKYKAILKNTDKSEIVEEKIVPKSLDKIDRETIRNLLLSLVNESKYTFHEIMESLYNKIYDELKLRTGFDVRELDRTTSDGKRKSLLTLVEENNHIKELYDICQDLYLNKKGEIILRKRI